MRCLFIVVASCVVWMIFVIVVNMVKLLYCHWSYTSSYPLAVSVAIMGMLDRRCDHEAEWQESSGQWHFVGPSAKCADLSTRKGYGHSGGWLH